MRHRESFRRVLRNNVTRYDVTLIYAGFAQREGGIQMACSKKGLPILKEILNNY